MFRIGHKVTPLNQPVEEKLEYRHQFHTRQNNKIVHNRICATNLQNKLKTCKRLVTDFPIYTYKFKCILENLYDSLISTNKSSSFPVMTSS